MQGQVTKKITVEWKEILQTKIVKIPHTFLMIRLYEETVVCRYF